jgi:hypothetical protein
MVVVDSRDPRSAQEELAVLVNEQELDALTDGNTCFTPMDETYPVRPADLDGLCGGNLANEWSQHRGESMAVALGFDSEATGEPSPLEDKLVGRPVLVLPVA